MARFMAYHTVPDMTKERFSESLKEVRKWRPDPRTTIIKVCCNLAEGKMVTECDAVDQAAFESWIQQVGWPVDKIYKVDVIAQTGSIWQF